MRKIFLCLLFSILVAWSFSGCNNSGNLTKQSLIKTYYEGPLQWGGITLGQSTIEEVRDALVNLDETNSDTYWEGELNNKSDSGICVEFYTGYRERGLCVWFMDNIAQFIDFVGGDMALGEIQDTLGGLEKISVYMIYRGQTEVIESEGISFNSGFIIFNSLEKVEIGNERIPDIEVIEESTIYQVYLSNPDYIDTYFGVDSAFGNFLFKEGGFQDWNGYGEYEVKETGL